MPSDEVSLSSWRHRHPPLKFNAVRGIGTRRQHCTINVYWAPKRCLGAKRVTPDWDVGGVLSSVWNIHPFHVTAFVVKYLVSILDADVAREFSGTANIR